MPATLDLPKTTAIAFSDEKGAAIYFDYVIPTQGYPTNVMSRPFVPPGWRNARYSKSSEKWLLTHRPPYLARIDHSDPLFGLFIDRWRKPKTLDDSALFRLAVSNRIPVTAIYGLDDQSEHQSGNEALAILLKNLNLIDPSKITWDQILEIRKDADSLFKLRQLQNFWNQNYSGKSRNQIIDDLHVRITEYEKTAKSWGEITTLSTASILLTGVFTTTLVSVLTGGAIGSAVGLVAATGLGALEIHQVTRRRELTNLQDRDPVQFLVEYDWKN